ncbi:VWA domain-containing protein [Planctomycetota bacterium]|nr:VWA domain-containing protein [Planctomycetota bacterium]
MNRRTHALAAFALGLVLASAAQAEELAPRLVRMAVIDCSGSMNGPRLQTAKAELLELGRQLPPSVNTPFMIVPFTSSARGCATFTDLGRFEAFVTGLSAAGGTKIAAGLERGTQELQTYQAARHWALILVTDGDDGDVDGIRAAEARLDALFAQRQQRGLSNTVFCKRWDGANADLVAELRRRGHATIIDGADGQMVALVFTPKFRVAQSEWAGDGRLAVRVAASLEVAGARNLSRLTPVRARCITADATGNVTVDIHPRRPQLLELTLPVAAEVAAVGGTVPLEFSLDQPGHIELSNGVAFPNLANDRVRLEVGVPARGVDVVLSARLRAAGEPRWEDPVAGSARVPVVIEVEAQSTPPAWPGPVVLAARASGSGVTLAQPAQFVLSEAGRACFQTALIVSAGGADVEISLVLTATPASPALRVAPAELPVQARLALPPPVVTRLIAGEARVTGARWVDVVEGVAAFEAEFELTVDGPLAPATELALQAPLGVRRLELAPGRISSGTQTITIRAQACLGPSVDNVLRFDLVPPPVGAVQIDGAPVHLVVVGPAPLQLATVHRGVPTTRIELVLETSGEVPLEILPVLPWDDGHVPGLPVRLKLVGELGEVQLDAWTGDPLVLPMRSGPGRSLLQDDVRRGELLLTPRQHTPAVSASRHEVVVRLEAPFKRLLCTGALFLFVASVMFGSFRLYTNLSQDDFDEVG